ncbi:MAG: aminotransferase class V-fold PLP-dependent enzyme, partial [Clostridia bacterium]|nr:aminotransferase class V-fold PLP-dependent enzyme [Clostridia bacterium]
HGSAIHEYENALIDRLREQLSEVPGVTVYGAAAAPHVGALSFNLDGRESAEVADALDARGICVRGGLHCAPCMHRWLGTQGTVRASVGPFSTEAEIDALADAVREIVKE